MARTQKRANIPKDVRRDLWVAAAGRCEFRGCNQPVGRDPRYADVIVGRWEAWSGRKAERV